MELRTFIDMPILNTQQIDSMSNEEYKKLCERGKHKIKESYCHIGEDIMDVIVKGRNFDRYA